MTPLISLRGLTRRFATGGDTVTVLDDVTRPYLAPPGLPAERLEILRRAFDATVRDPAFLADMARQKLEIDGPSSGEELSALVAQIAGTPPAVKS